MTDDHDSPTETPSDEETDAQLGARPDPASTAPEHHPGGVDAIDDPRYGETPGPPTVPDAEPTANPAVEDVVPDEISAPDDKQQAPDEDAAELDPEKTDEGTPEPPA